MATASAPRQRLLMDPQWRFRLGDPPAGVPDNDHGATYSSVKAGAAGGYAAVEYDDSAWREVDLPHDFAVEGVFDPVNNLDHGFLPTGVGWYRKTFYLPEEDRDRTAILIDMGYLNTEIMAVEGDAVIFHRTIPMGGGHVAADVAAGGTKVAKVAIPDDVNVASDVSVAPLSASVNKSAGAAFIEFITSAQGLELMTAAGFLEP